MMTFRDKTFIFGAAVAVLGLISVSVQAQESDADPVQQQDAPIQSDPADPADPERADQGQGRVYLGPDRVPEIERDPATGKPQSILPGPYVAPGSLVQTDGGTLVTFQPEQGLEIRELDQLDPAAIGLIDQTNGGFPSDMWQGTTRTVLETLLARLPGAVNSPAQNALLRRLLLTRASVPVAIESGPDAEQSVSIILETRLDRIAAAGDLKGLLGLLDRIPLQYDSPIMRRHKANAYLLDGNVDGACDIAERARSEDANPFWLQLTAFCQAIAGNQAGASLTVDLLRETNDAPLIFMELINRIQFEINNPVPEPGGRVGGVFDLFKPDPLNIAMMRAAGVEMPSGTRLDVPPLVLAALARAPNLALTRRADAALAAAGLDVINDEVMADIFAAMDFSDQEMQLAETLAETDLGARVDGLLYRAASLETDPAARLQIIDTAWRRVMKNGTWPALAPAFASLIVPLDAQSADLTPYAHPAGRILLFNNQPDEAKKWYDLVRGLAARSDIDATKALVDLWPLMIVADGSGGTPFSAQILSLWSQGLAILPPREQAFRTGILYGLLEALGYEIPAAMWDDAIQAGTRSGNAPSLADWRRLIQASRNNRFGETVLLSLIIIGDDGPGALNPSALTSVVNGLMQIGLERDARQIALEALIAHGF